MNNDLIEQVARAIFACHFADTAQAQAMLERDWPRGSPIKLMVQREAQAAIAAMQPHIEAQREAAARDALDAAATSDLQSRFPLGTPVRKVSGPQWHGVVVGYYSSSYTPEGLVIECTAEGARGQVHVEPAKRMERL